MLMDTFTDSLYMCICLYVGSQKTILYLVLGPTLPYNQEYIYTTENSFILIIVFKLTIAFKFIVNLYMKTEQRITTIPYIGN